MEEAKKKKEKKMKKLMFLAVVAAATVASAAVCVKGECDDEGAGTAYKVAISLKTTTVKSKTVKTSECEEPSCQYWREQKSVKVNGLIWAKLDDCSCDWINDSYYAAFWTKEGAVPAELAIGVGLIGKPDKKGYTKKAEGYGKLFGDDFGELSWGAFGSVARSTTKHECEDDECSIYLKSLSGNIAGWVIPGDYVGCEECDPVDYAICCDEGMLANTAAYGTIKISYDKSTAKKVALAADETNVASFYKLPAAAAYGIDDVVANVTIEE